MTPPRPPATTPAPPPAAGPASAPPRQPQADQPVALEPRLAGLLNGRTIAAAGTVAEKRGSRPWPHLALEFADGSAALLWLDATAAGPQINGQIYKAAARPLLVACDTWTGARITSAAGIPATNPRGFMANLHDGRTLRVIPTDNGQIIVSTTQEAAARAIAAPPAGPDQLAGPADPPAAPPHLVKLAAETRAAQTLYFRTRSPAALNEARALERRLDDALAAHFKPAIVDRQRSLFDP